MIKSLIKYGNDFWEMEEEEIFLTILFESSFFVKNYNTWNNFKYSVFHFIL